MKKNSIFIINKNIKFDLEFIYKKYPELNGYSTNVITRQTKMKCRLINLIKR